MRDVTFSAKPLGEVCKGLPLGGVHVDVLSVANVLIVDNVVVHTLGPCTDPKTQGSRGVLKHLRKIPTKGSKTLKNICGEFSNIWKHLPWVNKHLGTPVESS